jgi:hypothetical protein
MGNKRIQLKEMASELSKMASDREKEIDTWERKASLIISLVVLVGALGIITGVLQRYKDKKDLCKKATIVLGTLISLITFVNNTLFDVDHRVLLNKAKKAKRIIKEVHIELQNRFQIDSEDEAKEWMDRIHDKFREFDILTTSISKVNNSTQLSSPGILYAQQRAPLWIKRPPTDRQYLYFVGIGESLSLNQAKERSYQNSKKTAVQFFEKEMRKIQKGNSSLFNVTSLSKYLIKSAEVANTYYQKNSRRNYRYYTLLKINKRIVSTDFRFYAMKKKIPLTNEMKNCVIKMKQ